MSLAAFSQARPETQVMPRRRTIPFDYRFRFEVFDEEDEQRSFVDESLNSTVTVSIEASFTAVSIGYGLIPRLRPIEFGPREPEDLEIAKAAGVVPTLAPGIGPSPEFSRLTAINVTRVPDPLEVAVFGGVPRRTFFGRLTSPERRTLTTGRPARRILFGEVLNSLGRTLNEEDFVDRGEIGPRTAGALTNGIRLNPEVSRFLLLDHGQAPLDLGQLGALFETVEAPPERIQFLYALFDEGTGRTFQSEPILNIAGLGIDDGDRPFRHFVPPITFAPRTTIRLEVVPKSEFKGELQVVLHGYKVLGGAGTPTGRGFRRRRRRA